MRKGKILMNTRILRILFLALGLILAYPGYAAASEIKWQLIWSEDGHLYEIVQVPGNLEDIPAMANWNLVRDGELSKYSREISDWQTYQTQKDKLPLKVEQKNYFYYQKTSLMSDKEYGSDWFDQLNRENSLELTIKVPGLIFASNADEQSSPTAVWHFSQGTDLYDKDQLMNVIHIDGLLLGITIVGLGLVIGGSIFLRRLTKVDQIIAEEYGLPKQTNKRIDEE